MLSKYHQILILYLRAVFCLTIIIIRIDRLKEARGAIGGGPFDPYVLEDMVAVLSPYRRGHSCTAKTGLYLCAASLLNKTPLPHDSVLVNHLLNDFTRESISAPLWVHTDPLICPVLPLEDALLLSTRLVITNPAGVRSGTSVFYDSYSLVTKRFGRLIHSLLVLPSISGSILKQLKEIEPACKDLFGELEDDPKLQ